MKKYIIATILMLAIFGAVGCIGNAEDKNVETVTDPAQPVPTQPAVSPETEIISFEGDSTTTTRQFTAPDKWKIEWNTTEDDSQIKIFSIYLLNEKGESIDFIGNEDGAGHGETYMYENGTYALDISSTMPYNITVKTA